MLFAQDGKQALHGLQGLLTAAMAGNGHDLVRGQVVVLAQHRHQALHGL